jgi:hypothetical protein
LSVSAALRRCLVCGFRSAAAIWLAGLPFGISSADAQFYQPAARERFDDRPVIVRSRGGSTQYYVPAGVGGVQRGAFISSGGIVAPADFPRRSRWNNRGGDSLSHKANDQLRKAPPPPPVKGPLLIAISIASQKLTLYDDGVPIATSPVSTGTASHPTPTGVFAVIGKERFHRSNLYSAAPMPFMQRITWSGVALHAGVLPGYPASHGCIRLPSDFAIRLYGTTKMGARVIISQHDLTQEEIVHARLFAPKPKPPVEPVVANVTPEPVAATIAPAAGVSLPVPVKADEETAAAVKVAEVTANNSNDAAASSSDATPVPADESKRDNAAANTDTPAAAAAQPAVEVAAPIVAQVPVPAAAETIAETAARNAETVAKIEEAAGKIEVAPPPTAKMFTNGLRPTVAAVAPRLNLQRLRPGPVSAFVSRKERRLFVRKGFEPLFDVPVEIAGADQPLGTHVFTLMALDGDTARWSVVSMPAEKPKAKRVAEIEPRDARRAKRSDRAKIVDVAIVDTRPVITAAEALDRVVLPQDAVDRITEMLSVGASFIITDKDRGPETGEETDFVVLTR